MSAIQSYVHSAPFDAVADQYDQLFTESRIGQAQRASVWKELEKAFSPGDRVLEIGCGTGVDACFLGSHGVTVVASDSSPRMVEMTSRRVNDSKLQNFVYPRLLAAESIRILRHGVPFDGAFSNFGVLNCVDDLRQLALNLAAVLRPGAPALLCLMGPCCAWEIAWYLAQGQPGKAFRRMRRGRITARLADDATVSVLYPSVRSLTRIFSPEFRLRSLKGIGVSVPPSYVERSVARTPRWFDFCVRADSVLGRCPGIRLFSDHILLRFEREDL
jgi:ubiquinone/menaquinone biosynthesis C-methylase UbiE